MARVLMERVHVVAYFLKARTVESDEQPFWQTALKQQAFIDNGRGTNN
jgi:hypothetical protein